MQSRGWGMCDLVSANDAEIALIRARAGARRSKGKPITAALGQKPHIECEQDAAKV